MRQNRFISLKHSTLGSLNILWPVGLSGQKLYKRGSRIPFTKDPLIQSHFKRILSLPVIIIGSLHLYVPGTIRMYPFRGSLKRSECD